MINLKYTLLFLLLLFSTNINAQEVIDIEGKPSRMYRNWFAPTLSDFVVNGEYLAVVGFKFAEHPLLIISEGNTPNTEEIELKKEDIDSIQTLPITLTVNILLGDSTTIESEYTFKILIVLGSETVIAESFIIAYNFVEREVTDKDTIIFDISDKPHYMTELALPSDTTLQVKIDSINQKMMVIVNPSIWIYHTVLPIAFYDRESLSSKRYYIGIDTLDLGLFFGSGFVLSCKGFWFDLTMSYSAGEVWLEDTIIRNPNRILYSYCEVIQNNQVYKFKQREFTLPNDDNTVYPIFAIDSTEVLTSGLTNDPITIKFIVETKRSRRGVVAVDEWNVDLCNGDIPTAPTIPSLSHLYPNPTNQNSIVTIPVYSNEKEFLLVVYDSMGRIIQQEAIVSNFDGIKWDLSQKKLPIGVYYINVFNNRASMFSDKILIE